MKEPVLMRAIRHRLACHDHRFSRRYMRRDEFQALYHAGLVHQTGWYLSGAECWWFDDEAGRRLLASCDTQPEAGDVKQTPLVSGAVPKADARKEPPHDPR
jgi:hypothetical protein